MLTLLAFGNLMDIDLCKEFLDNSRVVKDSWINNDWIQKHIDNSDLDVKYVNKFLGSISFRNMV